MKDKFADFFKGKPFLIIFSVICAIVAWFFVLNFRDPMEERVMEIPVTISNSASLASYNLINTTESIPETVNVTVFGRKSVVDKLTSLDFKCSVDLSSVKSTGQVSIPISKPVCSVMGVTVRSYTPTESVFTFDKTGIVNLDVVIDYSQSLLKDGFEFISVVPDAESIQVTGFESDIAELDYIKIDLNDILDNNSIDSSKSASYIGKFISKNGENVSYKFDPVKIIVKIDVGKRVDLIYQVTGDPGDLCYVNSESISQDKVVLQGNATELNKIQFVNLGTVSVEGARESINKEVDILSFLPEGITCYGTSKVTVSVEILEYEEKSFTFSLGEISLAGYDKDEYIYDIQNSDPDSADSVTVTLKGIKEVLDDLKKSSLVPTLNLTGKSVGEYLIPLDFSIDTEDVVIVGEYIFKVEISSKVAHDVR